jgi:endonuclease-3
MLLLYMKASEKKDYARDILRLLKTRYADEMQTSLEHANPWELLVATMLSAQSQDKQVNKVTARLFKAYKKPADFARLDGRELYRFVRSLGLYRNKAKNIVSAAEIIETEFKGKVPKTMAGLTSLPGVGRKTANVVLSNAFGINEGIAIDTHCITVSNRLGLARTRDPEKIEAKLVKLFPRKEWSNVSHLFIALGRDTCQAKAKHCERCVLKRMCVSSTVKG